MLSDTLLFDIKNTICLYFYDLKDVINLYNLNKNHQNNIIITNLFDIQQKYIQKLDQKIIEQNKYKYLEKLYASGNKKIKNVNHMKNTLKILHCSWFCGIHQCGISELNLIELYASNNKNIKNVNHMKKTLKKLDCGWNCGIDQNGISELKLIELNIDYNEKIKNVNHMKNTLKILSCYGHDYGIDHTVYLNLSELRACTINKSEK